MATPITWITPDLAGTFTNLSFARVVISANDSGGSALTYTLFDGELPPGMIIYRHGLIQGIPDIEEISNTTNNITYTFTVKATNANGVWSKKTFKMIVNFKLAVVPTAKIHWITKAGTIGKFAEESDVSYQLDAYDVTGKQLEYTVIAGDLTSGLQLFKTGEIQGIPVVEQTSTTQTEFGQTFTVRASNTQGDVADRTFNIIINSIGSPRIIPRIRSLGSYYDGYYLDMQLEATDPNPMAKLQWSIIHYPMDTGLPPGITLNSNGALYGYIEPFTSNASQASLYWDNIGWDFIPWDSQTPKAQSKTYTFTVQVFDGSRYDYWTYTIFVQAKGLLTVDNTFIIVDSDTLTVDLDNRHRPYITTLPQDLPEQRQLSNFAFKFDGKDLDGSEIRYAVVNSGQGSFDQGPNDLDPLLPVIGFDQGPVHPGDNFPPLIKFDQDEGNLPPGVTLDRVTGWLTGNLGAQVEEKLTYTFYIYCYKDMERAGPPDPVTGEVTIINLGKYVSEPVKFTLTVLGDLQNVVTWSTPYDLGYMDNGDISELAVAGTTTPRNNLPRVLNYRLKEPAALAYDIEGFVKYTTLARSKLPQGLKLLSNGLIVGRTTFEYFSLDGGETTIDKDVMTFDYEYEFTVTASDETPTTPATVSSDKTFRIRIKNYNKLPYENIYLRALTSPAQRLDFTSLLNNADIFPPELIYRPTDPWFGKSKDIKFLFAAGMNPNKAADYIESMSGHHYNKRISLGEVKTAVALDENYNVKYEVVYVDAQDPQTGVAYSIDRTAQVADQYKTLPFSVVYPNSFGNMKKEVGTLGYANRGALPQWMLNQQEDGRVLGFTRGVVLAYTVPGASKLIAYRLQHSENKFEFNSIDFVADRYQLDHLLSKTYDIDGHKFYQSPETTFDRLDPLGGYRNYAGTVFTEELTRNEAILDGLNPVTDAIIIQSRIDAAVIAMPHIAVDYAVHKPFDEINGKTISYILNHGGVDGVATIKTGQYLIFAKQENFTQTAGQSAMVIEPYDTALFDRFDFDEGSVPEGYNKENDGWNVEYGMYDSTYYAQTPYAPSNVVPGWDAKIATGTTNQRAGIWKVVVNADNVVFLEFVIETNINEYVQIKNGQSFGDTRLYYDPIVKANQTVPGFSLLSNTTRNSQHATRFDAGATRFFSNVDMYAEPETDDIYLKFPKFNVYH